MFHGSLKHFLVKLTSVSILSCLSANLNILFGICHLSFWMLECLVQSVPARTSMRPRLVPVNLLFALLSVVEAALMPPCQCTWGSGPMPVYPCCLKSVEIG
jgi:hypothetical protein